MCVKEQFEEKKNQKKKHLDTSQKIKTVAMDVKEPCEEQSQQKKHLDISQKITTVEMFVKEQCEEQSQQKKAFRCQLEN